MKNMKKNFKCDVDCANCAAKMEEAIKKLDGVKDVRINFLTQKFMLETEEEIFEVILEESIKVMKKIDKNAEVYR